MSLIAIVSRWLCIIVFDTLSMRSSYLVSVLPVVSPRVSAFPAVSPRDLTSFVVNTSDHYSF